GSPHWRGVGRGPGHRALGPTGMSQLPSARRGPTLAERLAAFRYHADEDVSSLLLPPPDAGPVAPAPAEEALGEYLSFELSGTTYAVPLGAVQEILRARR